jgi:hypothetical protein
MTYDGCASQDIDMIGRDSVVTVAERKKVLVQLGLV